MKRTTIFFFTMALLIMTFTAGVPGAAAETVTYAYDANGRLTGADYGNGSKIVYTYDANGNLTQRSTQASPGALRVNITPDTAQWRRTGTGIWRNSGTTESNVTPGNYQVEFSILAGYNNQPNRNVLIESGKTRTLNETYTANTNTYAVEAAVSGPGGRVVGTDSYLHNSLVRLEAISDKGYRFAHWKDAQGRIVSTNPVYEFRATGDLTLTAHFREAVGLSGIMMLLLE